MEDVRLLTLQLLITVHCTRMCHFGPQNKSSKEAVWRVVKVATHKLIPVVSSIAIRFRELDTVKGRMESMVKLKGLDLGTIQHSYTV